MFRFKKVIFYNDTHNGDLHLAREAMKLFYSRYRDQVEEWSHSHINSEKVLKDVGIPFSGDSVARLMQRTDDLKVHVGPHLPDVQSVYLNTWIGAGKRALGVRFSAIKDIFGYYAETLFEDGWFRDAPLESFVPQIDYSQYRSERVNRFLQTRYTDRRRVFFANNFVMSGQARNNVLSEFIGNLARRFPKTDFFVTNKIFPLVVLNNVFYTDDILGFDSAKENNLNENSFISTFCDVIIGRGSGPFTFALVKKNFNKTFISMTHAHLKSDVFNGFDEASDGGTFHHTADEREITNILEGILK